MSRFDMRQAGPNLRWSLGRIAGLFALLCLSACTFHTSRVVTLEDVPVSESLWRPAGEAVEPLFVETTGQMVRKGQMETAIFVEPPLEDHLRRELEAALGAKIDRLRVVYVGYEYAYYFPSRQDDFVLRIDLDAPAANVHGELEGRVRGNELPYEVVPLEEGWRNAIPDTGAGLDEDEDARALERRADQRAWVQRCYLLEAVRRLAASVVRS